MCERGATVPPPPLFPFAASTSSPCHVSSSSLPQASTFLLTLGLLLFTPFYTRDSLPVSYVNLFLLPSSKCSPSPPAMLRSDMHNLSRECSKAFADAKIPVSRPVYYPLLKVAIISKFKELMRLYCHSILLLLFGWAWKCVSGMMWGIRTSPHNFNRQLGDDSRLYQGRRTTRNHLLFGMSHSSSTC